MPGLKMHAKAEVYYRSERDTISKFTETSELGGKHLLGESAA